MISERVVFGPKALSMIFCAFLISCSKDVDTESQKCQLASAWNTVDTFQVDGKNSQAFAFGIDASGNLYTVGNATNGASVRAIVRKSSNSGASWNTVDDFLLAGGGNSQLYAFGVDAAGNLFTAGSASDGTNTRAIVRKSSNLGATWTTVDNFLYLGGNFSAARAFGVGPSGSVYTAGYARDGTNTRYIVRKSSDSGSTWTTVDNFLYSPGTDTRAYAFGIDSSRNLYSAGYAFDGINRHYIVRKSNDFGSTWTTVDNFLYAGMNSASASAFGNDANGNIYTTGNGFDGINYHYIVRKSANSGGSWSTVDDFLYAGGSNSFPSGFGADVSGNLYTVGYGHDGTNYHYIVRKSANSGVAWSTVDDFSNPGGEISANAFGSDVNGNLYTAGNGRDQAGNSRWIVRKLACLR